MTAKVGADPSADVCVQLKICDCVDCALWRRADCAGSRVWVSNVLTSFTIDTQQHFKLKDFPTTITTTKKNIICPNQVKMCSPSCLHNLCFFLLLSLPGFSYSCKVSNVSLVKNDKRKEVQPLEILLSFVYSAAICALHVNYGQTGADLCLVWMNPLAQSTWAPPMVHEIANKSGPSQTRFTLALEKNPSSPQPQ